MRRSARASACDSSEAPFPRRIHSDDAGRCTIPVITKGVNPNLHIAHKHCRIKQCFNEERAFALPALRWRTGAHVRTSIPVMVGLTGAPNSADAVATAQLWSQLNDVRHLLVFGTWVAAIQALIVAHRSSEVTR